MRYDPNNPNHRARPDIVFAVLKKADVLKGLENGGPVTIAQGFPAYHSLEAADEQASALMRQHVDVYAVSGVSWGLNTAPDPEANHVRWQRSTKPGTVHAIDRSSAQEQWRIDSYPKGQDRRIDHG